MRLDKYLCDMGLGTRSQIKADLKKGLVTVDGVVCRKPETKVDENNTVTYAGDVVSYVTYEYYLLHKPAGVITATEDRRQETVLDLILDKQRKDLSPVGRLDKDTEGLLLITNDGALNHKLLSPKSHVDKTYYAKISGELKESFVQMFREGLDIGDEKPTLPADLKILSEDEIELTIREGRFHQVKRMFEAVGCEVTYLKRLSMGPLTLDPDLAPGEYRPLTEEELSLVRQL